MMEPYPNLEFQEQEIDLREYLRVIQKWRKVIIIGTLFAVVTAAVLSYLVLPPVYEARTMLVVTQATKELGNTGQVFQGQKQTFDTVMNSLSTMPVLTMNTYMAQLTSETLMKRVIDALKLDKEEYTPESLAGMVTAEVVKDSNLIQVKVQNSDPELAAAIARTIGEEFLAMLNEKNQEQMTRSVEFLNQQRKATEQQLIKAELALEAFQKQPRGVEALQQQFDKTAEQLALAQTELGQAEVEAQQIQASLVAIKNSMESTAREIVVTRTDASGKPYQTIETNPSYTALEQQLNEKQAALAEKQAQVAGLRRLVAETSRKLDSLQAELANKRMQQDDLQREVDRLKNTANTLAQKTIETQIARSIDLAATTAMIVSEPDVPESPVKPNKKLNIAVAFVLGLMAFTILAFVLEYLDNTVKSAEQIDKLLDIPVLGVIPYIKE